MTGRSAWPGARSIGVLAAIVAILAAACGAVPFTSPAAATAIPVGPVASSATAAPEASDAAPPNETGSAGGQIGGTWRSVPVQLADSQVAIVSDACAAKARETLGEGEADLPTATVDARGEGLVTAILSDDAQAIVCAARMDGAGNATVDSVDRLATTSFEPQDGTHVSVTELIRLDDPPGARTLAFGRVGPDPAQVKLGFPDQSTLVASSDNGWWLAWWPGTQRTNAIAGVDAQNAVIGSAKRRPTRSSRGSGRPRGGSTRTSSPRVRTTPSCRSRSSRRLARAARRGLDRLDPPTIDLTDTTIVVTLAIKRQPGAQDCQGNAPFSFDLELPEPLAEPGAPRRQREPAARRRRSRRRADPARPGRRASVAEELLDLQQAVGEQVDVVAGRVDAEARPRGRGQVEPLVERHRAVMAGPDGDPEPVEHLGDVVRVDARQVERHDPAAGIRIQRPVQLDAGDARRQRSPARSRRARARGRGRRPSRSSVR